MGHIDDSLLIGQRFNSSERNAVDAVSLATNLGFKTHLVKSVFQPQEKMDFLGFVLNSLNVTITFTEGKAMTVRFAPPKGSHSVSENGITKRY